MGWPGSRSAPAGVDEGVAVKGPIRVTSSDLLLHEGSIHVGLQVRGPDDAWLQFALLEIPLSLFTAEQRRDIGIWMEDDRTPDDEDDELPLWQEEPTKI